jgi:hypothetical protein
MTFGGKCIKPHTKCTEHRVLDKWDIYILSEKWTWRMDFYSKNFSFGYPTSSSHILKFMSWFKRCDNGDLVGQWQKVEYTIFFTLQQRW